MRTLPFAMWVLPAGLMTLGASGVVCGQDFPSKPIRVITTPVGGNSATAGRLIAQTISIGQPVIVDHRPANVIGEAVAKAPPDGYTLILQGSPLWIEPLMQSMPYDFVSDFAPVTWVTKAPHLLVVHPSLPVKSVKELIVLAKAKPGALNYNSAGVGSGPHLAAELFKAMAGLSIVHIQYKGGGLAVVGLLTGDGQLMFASAPSVAPHLKTGRLKTLAVTSPQPSALAPGLPTVAAAGLPGFESSSTAALLAPAKTPVAIINRLNQEFVRVLTQADVKEKLFNSGMEVVASSPEQLAVLIKTEVTVWGKVIKDAGIRIH